MSASPTGQLTRAETLQCLTTRFRAAGLESPLADARLLLAHALEIDRLALHTEPDVRISSKQQASIEAFAARRLAHEPVSRIIGERWFYGRRFTITPAILDPRPDSETIITAALEILAANGDPHRPLRILDIGTGSGCLLLTLLAELPNAVGIGTDISSDALAVAARNAADLQLADRATFRLGPDLEPADGIFDLIVSNPPYIPTSDIQRLDPDVRGYDPVTALDGGADGLDVYRRLSRAYSDFISDGWLVLEVGDDQADDVCRLFAIPTATRSSPKICTFPDLAGHSRCVAVCPRPTATR